MKYIKSLVSLIILSIILTACSTTNVGQTSILKDNKKSDKLNIVTTTPIIADFVKNVTKDKANVKSLVPNGADPHSYEPTFRQTRDVAYANIAFSNYLTLEEHSVIKMLDNNLPPKAKNIALAESAIPKGLKTINLVENRALDTIWLGLRVNGSKNTLDRSQQVEIALKKVEGPGKMFGYLTESFGEPNIYFNSQNLNGEQKAVLPTDAHTHMSWAFTKPGVYKATFSAIHKSNGKITNIGNSTFTFAVGTKAHEKFPNKKIFDKNHADITVDLNTNSFKFTAAIAEGDEIHNKTSGGKETEISNKVTKNENFQKNVKDDELLHSHSEYKPEDVVIEVPNKAMTQIPAEIEFKFLGKAGESIYLLPQAVLGKHVHGELDPHLWLNAVNAKYYVDVIVENLISLDPVNAQNYMKNAEEYKKKLTNLHEQILKGISSIPKDNRHLITTHDSFGYFAKAYGMKIAGFVTPNPSTQPSVAERKKLTETISNLKVKAVFLEPNVITKSSVLKQIADEQGVKVCKIWSDTFTPPIDNYLGMMEANLQSMLKCLK